MDIITFRDAMEFLSLFYRDWHFDLINGKRDDWKEYWREDRYFAYLGGRLETSF